MKDSTDLNVEYSQEPNLSMEEFIDVLSRSTLAARRPVNNLDQIHKMLLNADILISARNSQGLLIGVARSISDCSYCTYLSDLAVDQQYQRLGIGKKLIEKTRELAGEESRLILLAAPAAKEYYPRIGMVHHDSCWMLPPRDGD